LQILGIRYEIKSETEGYLVTREKPRGFGVGFLETGIIFV
jgi:hypothetical protein